MARITNSPYLRETAKLALGGGVGFLLFWLTSHPRSRVHKRLPAKKIKNVHVLPRIQIQHKNREYHLHHWLNLSSLYLLLLLKRRRVLRSKVVHGFFLGSILQGLTYKDRFKIIKKPILELDIIEPTTDDEITKLVIEEKQ